MKPNYHMKILEEQLPKTYLQIEEVVNELRDIHHLTIIPREEFWLVPTLGHVYLFFSFFIFSFSELPKVKRVIDEASEVNAAMDYLHDSTYVHTYRLYYIYIL